jgi:hypothetical protein
MVLGCFDRIMHWRYLFIAWSSPVDKNKFFSKILKQAVFFFQNYMHACLQLPGEISCYRMVITIARGTNLDKTNAYIAFSCKGYFTYHICCDTWLLSKVMSKRPMILISKCQGLAKEQSLFIYFKVDGPSRSAETQNLPNTSFISESFFNKMYKCMNRFTAGVTL